MQAISNDPKGNVAFLLLSFKDESMEKVMDNLKTKLNLTYVDAYIKLMEIYTRREGFKAAEVLNANQTSPISSNTKYIGTCKERNKKFQGHMAKECRKKKNAKKEGNQAANIGVADMNATCFIVYSRTIPVHLLPRYTQGRHKLSGIQGPQPLLRHRGVDSP